MEEKKRVIPGEICIESSEKGNRGYIRKTALRVDHSTREPGRAEPMEANVTDERKTTWREQKRRKCQMALQIILGTQPQPLYPALHVRFR